MKKKWIFLVVLLFTVIIASFVLDISIDRYDFSLAGSNKDFAVTLESHGTDIWFMWNGYLRNYSPGKAVVKLEYIGNDEAWNDVTELSYAYDFNSFGASGDVKGSGSKVFGTSRRDKFIKVLDEEYRVDISLNGVENIIYLEEVK